MSRSNLFNGSQVSGLQAHAVATLEHLDSARTRLANAKAAKKKAEADLADHEVDLTAEYRAANAEMSQTQFDKQVKVHIGQNTSWRKLRDEVNRLDGEVETADADRSVLSRDIEIANSAMIGLGGEMFRSAVEAFRNI